MGPLLAPTTGLLGLSAAQPMTRVRSRRAGHPARLSLGISVPGNSQRCPQRSLPSGLYLLASLPQTPPTILLRWDVDHDRGVPGLPPCQPHPLSVKLRPVLPLAVASNGGGGMAQGPVAARWAGCMTRPKCRLPVAPPAPLPVATSRSQGCWKMSQDHTISHTST